MGKVEAAESTADQPCSQLLALPTQKNALRYQKQKGWLHCWSGVSWLQRYSIVWLEWVSVCVWELVLYRVVSGRRADVTYSLRGFTEHSWQTQDDFLEPPSPCTLLALFPKITVMLCHYGNKWLLVLKCIDNYGKSYKLSRHGLSSPPPPFCLFSFPWLSRRGERPRISWGLWRKVDVTSNEPTIKETLWRVSWLETGNRKDRGWRQSRWQPRTEQSINTKHRSSLFTVEPFFSY